ncbi:MULTISPECIES: hypothetical protein [Lactobacillus]|uniref:Uncharacterized protein n=1 Tax=Lactobacillus xujianguonis TaxID=2495899 RepID=A0A437STA7_9LACO|nr:MULTISPECIES: hypothetical protein [Lactobacillus]RVU70179.1 hypothetical protein EJK17_09105 [Lactobacillus xujianguonis]RVU73516.1 hypothetical protein EJK20_07735 [Lactobacillus xujianguonis]
MTPKQYEELRKRFTLLERAKYLDKHAKAQTAANMIKKIAFKQEAGMMPDEYIKKYKNSWKKQR